MANILRIRGIKGNVHAYVLEAWVIKLPNIG